MTHADGAPAGLATAADLLAETWSQAHGQDIHEDPARTGLLAVSCFADVEPHDYHATVLESLLRLFNAERGFLFRVDSQADAGPACECLASLDLDGDQLANPDRKADLRAIHEAASSGRPLWRPLSPEGEKGGSLVALPAISRGETRCVVLLENRFQDVRVNETAAERALVCCRALAAFHDLRTLAAQNEALWRDLAHLHERLESRRGSESDADAPLAPQSSRTSTGRPTGRRGSLKGDYSLIVGSSGKILEILEVIDRISGSNAPVLINGESGTGKELAALAVHRNSPRRNGTFVSENCGAITETLLESELFGYVKGAFTGANKDHKGLFELACGGTLFLDEVGDMSSSMQKKLLRVLQEGVIRRVGAKDFTPVDVRIISATNKDLLDECRAGNFREDLYYRLNVINLRLPPLRERREDVAALVEYFLAATAREGEPTKRIEAAAMEVLKAHSWPGNIRELQNEVKKLVALGEGDTIRVSDLSEHLRVDDGAIREERWTDTFSDMSLRDATEALEKALIRRALEETGGNKSLVAKSLQIPKTSLYNKIHKYQLT